MNTADARIAENNSNQGENEVKHFTCEEDELMQTINDVVAEQMSPLKTQMEALIVHMEKVTAMSQQPQRSKFWKNFLWGLAAGAVVSYAAGALIGGTSVSESAEALPAIE